MSIQQVRVLIPDLDIANPVFTNVELTAFLNIFGGNVLRAAAAALLAVATNEALLKKMHTDDLGFDGPAGADMIRRNAAILLAEADKQDAASADEAFLIAYPTYDGPFRAEATPSPFFVGC